MPRGATYSPTSKAINFVSRSTPPSATSPSTGRGQIRTTRCPLLPGKVKGVYRAQEKRVRSRTYPHVDDRSSSRHQSFPRDWLRQCCLSGERFVGLNQGVQWFSRQSLGALHLLLQRQLGDVALGGEKGGLRALAAGVAGRCLDPKLRQRGLGLQLLGDSLDLAFRGARDIRLAGVQIGSGRD